MLVKYTVSELLSAKGSFSSIDNKCVSDKKVKLKKITYVFYMINLCCNMSVHVVLVMLGLPWLIDLALY